MSKFNQTTIIKTKNKSGHIAYKMSAEEKLVTQILTTFFNESKYYGDNSKEIVSLLKVMAEKKPEFVAKLGIFARYNFNMRSTSHIIGAVLANVEQSKPYTRKYIKRVCRRSDDMTEILACYITLFGKPIPNSLKKGLADALLNFDEYSLAKYDRGGTVKFSDLIKIVHPTPRAAEQAKLWKRALQRELQVPLTWETQLSAYGNNAATWERLISEDALGYLAMLRNLRNIIETNPQNIDVVYQRLTDIERVQKSRLLPFRFYSAYRELKNHSKSTSKTIDALESAISAAITNIDQIPGKSLIAIDVSGSMGGPVSRRSTMTCRDIACLIGVIASRICEDALVVTFDTKIRKHVFSHRDGILQAADAVQALGGGTNIHLPFEYLMQYRIKVDRVILLSDNEVNSSTYGGWDGKRKTVQQTAADCRKWLNPNMWVHAIDLQGYGTQQFIGDRTNIIAGWSEKVLEFISLAESGEGSLVSKIESIKL